MNTDLPKIRLIQHGRVNRITQMLQAALIREQEEWGSVQLFVADIEEFYEIHSITGFSGDCKTHIIINDDVWDEILTYMDLSTDEGIAASRLLLFDKAGNAIHEFFPIGQQGDETYLAIDDINNVDFELDLDDDDDDDDIFKDEDDDIEVDDDDNDDDNDIIEVDGLAEFLKSLADKDGDALDTKSGWDTDLRQIVLGNHSLEQWKEIVLIVNCDSDDEETISITSTFRGDLKTYCVLTADEWQEIRQSMKEYDADNCKLEIRDGGWGESHALIPIGQRGDDVYLAIDDINNVEFEFED